MVDSDCNHTKKICKDFEINKKFRQMLWFLSKKWYIIISRCLWKLSNQIFGNLWTRSTKIFPASGLGCQAAFKKTRVKFELLTDIGMILMAEKEIRGAICQAIHQYANTNNKYTKD